MMVATASCGVTTAYFMSARPAVIWPGRTSTPGFRPGSWLEGRPGFWGAWRRMGETDGQDGLSARLLEQVAAGDRDAFRQLYDLHAPRLHAFALRITRQGPLAADAVHDAFLQVWRNAARFDATRGNPVAWLLGLVRYRALDIARRRGREVPDDDMPERADEDPDPLQRLVSSRDAAALHACLGQLPQERQKLVLMAFVEGLTHGDLAERLAIPLGTVKSWIRRSLQSLRVCLESGQ